jgi:hypothetical protein
MRRTAPDNWSCLSNRNRPRFYTAWTHNGNPCTNFSGNYRSIPHWPKPLDLP